MSATQFSQTGNAWTTEKPVADENSIMCMIQDCLSDVRGRKVKDLQRLPNPEKSVTVGTSPRSRKAMEMQTRHFSDRPVSNDLLMKGSYQKDLKQSCFLPSEKPTAAFLTTLDPIIRKALSSTLAADLKTHSPNPNPEISIITEETAETDNEETLLTDESQNENSSANHVDQTASKLWSAKNSPERTNSVRSSNSAFSQRNPSVRSNCSHSQTSPLHNNDHFSQRNPSVRSNNFNSQRSISAQNNDSFQHRNPSVRSNGTTTLYPQPMTDYRRKLIQKSMSLNVRSTRTVGVERRFSENRFDRRKLCSSDGSKTSSASSSSSRSGDSLPVFDLRDLETDRDQVDSLLIPGMMCNSDEDKQSDMSGSVLVNRSSVIGDADDIEHFIKVRRANSVRFNKTESDSETDDDDLFPNECPEHCNCELCQVTQCNNPAGIVQYLHGDVIKTYDWLTNDAKETEL